LRQALGSQPCGIGHRLVAPGLGIPVSCNRKALSLASLASAVHEDLRALGHPIGRPRGSWFLPIDHSSPDSVLLTRALSGARINLGAVLADMETLPIKSERLAQLEEFARCRGKSTADALDDVLANYLERE